MVRKLRWAVGLLAVCTVGCATEQGAQEEGRTVVVTTTKTRRLQNADQIQRQLHQAEAQRRAAAEREQQARLQAQQSQQEALEAQRAREAERAQLAAKHAEEAQQRAEAARKEMAQRDAELAQLRDQQQKLRAQLEQQKQQSQQLQQTQQQLQQRDEELAKLQDEQQRLQAQVQQQEEAAKQRDEALAAEQRERQEAEARTRKALEQVATVRKEARGLVVSLAEPVLFPFNEATLLPGARVRLDVIASALRQSGEGSFRVEGHTDSIGSDSFNVDLSRRRAQAVRDYLIQQGVAPEQIQAVGYGELRPIASNETTRGRAENRRVEIVLPEFGSGPAMGGAGSSGTEQPQPGR